MSIGRDPVFFQIMQSALNRAYPSGLPSNQVITQFAMPQDNLTLPDAIKATLIEQGYPYGWGEMVATVEAGVYELTEPMNACWLLRLDAQIPSGSAVSLYAGLGYNTFNTLFTFDVQPIQQINPAQTLIYADDLFRWSPAIPLGRVGISPWGIPSGWVDMDAVWMGPVANAQLSAPIGQWLLRKWVWFPVTDNYNVAFTGNDIAGIFMDGVSITPGSTVQVTAGWHLLTISCINTGSIPTSPTGVLLSIKDSTGNIIENGSYHSIVGPTWQTSGYINPIWTAVTSAADMRYSWYVIPASLITSQNVELQVIATGSPKINGVFLYSVAPWHWDEGGQYDAVAAANTPSQGSPVQVIQVIG